jgi:hypothetical protein
MAVTRVACLQGVERLSMAGLDETLGSLCYPCHKPMHSFEYDFEAKVGKKVRNDARLSHVVTRDLA